MKIINSKLLTTAAFMALCSAPSLHAQDSDEAAENTASEEAAEEEVSDVIGGIVVTGSRIRRPNFEAVEPTTSIDADFIEQRNFVNVADAINNLPQIRGSVTPGGAQGAFGQGVNFINNFGLGSNRTLTLINGRRVVSANSPSSFGNGGAGLQVDTNIIPTALVKRIDIVSTAGAPVYGSDAIAGTLNFILDDRYEGLSLNATSSISEEGDNFVYRFEGVWGDSFADGRGHIQISSFYTDVQGLVNSSRDFLREDLETNPNVIDEGRVNPNLGVNVTADDGIPGTALFRNIRLFPLSNTGVIFGGPLGVTTTSPTGTSAFAFDTNGNLIPFTVGTRLPGIRATGGDGFRFSDFGQITSDLRRFGANVFANYDVTDNINVFVEAQYYDARADELVQQPTFNTPLFGGLSSALTFNVNNPFLNDQARGILTGAGVTNFTISRVNVGLADTTGFAQTEFLRGVVGARGDFQLFNNAWSWEASATYGQNETSDFRQDINAQNFINATNVTTNANGDIICDANPVTSVQAAFRPVADANCVPFNFFGNQASQEALDYILSDTVSISLQEQVVFNANVSGELFTFNGNPIDVALGYEHRNENGSFQPSSFEEDGLGRAVAIAPVAGEFNLDEVFGEINLPLILPSNDSFVHKLEFFGRGRYVDNTVNGGFTSWAAGGAFAPIQDVEFRASFTRSFRTPAIRELFAPQTNAFATVPDLCQDFNIAAGPNPTARTRNCNAFLAAFPNLPRPTLSSQATIPILTGGNPNLANEQADSFTIGAIVRPRFIKNLAVTLDYINIAITDPIAALNAAQIAGACFDNDIFDVNDPANGNQFCSLIQRQANGEVVNNQLAPGVLTGNVNGQAIDFETLQGEFDYFTNLDDIGIPGRLNIRGFGTYLLFRQTDITGVAPNPNHGVIGDPIFQGQISVNYSDDDWGIGTTVNYVGRQLFSRNDRGPTPNDIREFDSLDGYFITDFNVFLNTEDNFRVNFVVTNLFNRQGQTVFDSLAFINDSIGRSYSVSVTKRF